MLSKVNHTLPPYTAIIHNNHAMPPYTAITYCHLTLYHTLLPYITTLHCYHTLPLCNSTPEVRPNASANMMNPDVCPCVVSFSSALHSKAPANCAHAGSSASKGNEGAVTASVTPAEEWLPAASNFQQDVQQSLYQPLSGPVLSDDRAHVEKAARAHSQQSAPVLAEEPSTNMAAVPAMDLQAAGMDAWPMCSATVVSQPSTEKPDSTSAVIALSLASPVVTDAQQLRDISSVMEGQQATSPAVSLHPNTVSARSMPAPQQSPAQAGPKHLSTSASQCLADAVPQAVISADQGTSPPVAPANHGSSPAVASVIQGNISSAATAVQSHSPPVVTAVQGYVPAVATAVSSSSQAGSVTRQSNGPAVADANQRAAPPEASAEDAIGLSQPKAGSQARAPQAATDTASSHTQLTLLGMTAGSAGKADVQSDLYAVSDALLLDKLSVACSSSTGMQNASQSPGNAASSKSSAAVSNMTSQVRASLGMLDWLLPCSGTSWHQKHHCVTFATTVSWV